MCTGASSRQRACNPDKSRVDVSSYVGAKSQPAVSSPSLWSYRTTTSLLQRRHLTPISHLRASAKPTKPINEGPVPRGGSPQRDETISAAPPWGWSRKRRAPP